MAAGDVEVHVERVSARADAGGHAASPDRLRHIYEASVANLVRALREFERVDVYDNSGRRPELLLEVDRGRILYAHAVQPAWLRAALRGTEYERQLPGPEDWRGVRTTSPGAVDQRGREGEARDAPGGLGGPSGPDRDGGRGR